MLRLRRIKRHLLILICTCFLTPAFSQDAVKITGQVADVSSGAPLEYATVAAYENGSNRLLAGVVTDQQGNFSLETDRRDFHLKVSYLGYLELLFDDFEVNGNSVNAGLLKVQPNNQVMDELVVTGEKSVTTFQLDKRVFNVGKDLSNAGGNAFDVLTNVPSVDVNIEGEVSLRGNTNVQILINGKPSVITSGNALGTISADMIEKVEVITNPSAKYDAEGTTGILNIVLKKEEKRGLNGSVTANTGVPNNHSLGLSLNKRTDKFNLFSQLGFGVRRFLSNTKGVTIDRSSDSPTELRNEGDGEKNEQFYNIILGTDYHINQFNVLTLTGHFGYEIEDEFSDAQFEFFDDQNELLSSTRREEVTEGTNPKGQYELQFKRSWPENEERSLLASATGSYFGKDRTSEFNNETLEGNALEFQQLVADDFANAQYNFQIDYTHPFANEHVLEVGSRYQIDDNTSDYRVDDIIDGQLINNPNFTNEFDFDQKVLAFYSTYAIELDVWSFKAGLRVENTDLTTLLRTTDEGNSRNYTDLFPTFHSSYKLSKYFSLQAGYSRRISRPRGWSLNPFSSIRDNLNIRTGNPFLLPEYTDSYEVSAIREWNQASLNASLFHRRTTDVVDRITVVLDTLSISTPRNVGFSRNTGIELNGKLEPAKWITLSGDFNWEYFKRSGTFETNQFDFSNTTWRARLTTQFKLPHEFSGEIRVRYRSEEQQVQSTLNDNAFMDLGVKKKFLKGRAVANLSVRDVFSSRRFITRADQPDFFRINNRQWNRRTIVLGLSYGFGKGDAMEFSGLKQF